MFAILTAVGAFLLPALYGRDWSGSLLPYFTFPVQMIVSFVSFAFLFITRRYTGRFWLGGLAVLGLSLLASFAMFAAAPIHMFSYSPGP